jgi:hypothetical protein
MLHSYHSRHWLPSWTGTLHFPRSPFNCRGPLLSVNCCYHTAQKCNELADILKAKPEPKLPKATNKPVRQRKKPH